MFKKSLFIAASVFAMNAALATDVLNFEQKETLLNQARTTLTNLKALGMSDTEALECVLLNTNSIDMKDLIVKNAHFFKAGLDLAINSEDSENNTQRYIENFKKDNDDLHNILTTELALGALQSMHNPISDDINIQSTVSKKLIELFTSEIQDNDILNERLTKWKSNKKEFKRVNEEIRKQMAITSKSEELDEDDELNPDKPLKTAHDLQSLIEVTLKEIEDLNKIIEALKAEKIQYVQNSDVQDILRISNELANLDLDKIKLEKTFLKFKQNRKQYIKEFNDSKNKSSLNVKNGIKELELEHDKLVSKIEKHTDNLNNESFKLTKLSDQNNDEARELKELIANIEGLIVSARDQLEIVKTSIEKSNSELNEIERSSFDNYAPYQARLSEFNSQLKELKKQFTIKNNLFSNLAPNGIDEINGKINDFDVQITELTDLLDTKTNELKDINAKLLPNDSDQHDE